MAYLNISGYKFIKLTNLESLKRTLHQHCLTLSLKGTILLSEEGINLFVCGLKEAIQRFYRILPDCIGATVDFKESISQFVPFKRMLLKIKPEIITMGIPHISPATHPAPTISPTQFKHWLDEDAGILILDTRNQYEIAMGKFEKAIDLNIETFRDFPNAIKQLPESYKEKTIVTYCTGGIRCEKAAPYLIEQGFKKVYQLEGGILNYLEKCSDAHYEGTCFVFDNRIALDASLSENDAGS